MKNVALKIHVLLIHSDGDTYTYLYKTREDAIDHLYERASENWSDTFDDTDIDDYDKEGAVDHYYSYADCGYYTIEVEHVSFTVVELQDEIAKAIGLATHG
jgi:hypothetical protein